jgi:predicted deacylase
MSSLGEMPGLRLGGSNETEHGEKALLESRGTRRNITIFIAIMAVVAAIGLTIDFAILCHVGDPAIAATPIPSTALAPTLATSDSLHILSSTLRSRTPTRIVRDATPTVSPTVAPSSPTPRPQSFFKGPFTYGTSFGGRPLLAYRFGVGPSVRIIIGGIHGGYEWNTVTLVSETLEYLQENPARVPEGITLYVVPCANPDGYAAGTDREHGRVNGNNVDLNRNWDYQWQPTATHGTRPVSGGAFPFSEPETAALRDLILEQDVEAAIFYHSALTRVFYGAEWDRSATYELAVMVSEATGYPVAAGVPGQYTTGDAIDWMSAQGLAGIEVELVNHHGIEWERNLRGLLAFLSWTVPPAPTEAIQVIRIGSSVQERPVEVTRVGNGDQVALVVIGGIHGDEVNTGALVRSLMAKYASAPELASHQFTLYFLPTMNPDGWAAGTRSNANHIDLDRNWPTDEWQADTARSDGVVLESGGVAPGSAPEVQAISRWLLDVVKPAVQEVWLLSYRSAYIPDGRVRPGYTVYGTPGPQADQVAQRVAQLSGYAYLPIWPSEHPRAGELIHWCDLNGIWAVEVVLPGHHSPDTIPSRGSETMLATHQRVVRGLMADWEQKSSLPIRASD